MPKYYTTLRINVETKKRLVKAKGSLERQTGEMHSLEKTLNAALDDLEEFTILNYPSLKTKKP
jgi:hypothetical protein